MVTRWDAWFTDENLAQDKRILSAPQSQSAEQAARAFLARKKRLILDLACGVGRDTFYLESYGLVVVGVDASLNGLRVAHRLRAEQGAASELVLADARYLPFRDGSFEGVYCFGLLHEFTGEGRDEAVDKLINELGRASDEGGVLVLTALAGEPEAGLPAVQLHTREMFENATAGLEATEIKQCDDVGCTGSADYCIWYGLFEK
jgi:ubiquinone/menaquinone biosynthesis C-methylase UbiE